MVALAPSGERIVAWEQQSPGTGTEGFGTRIAAPGADFAAAQVVSAPQILQRALVAGADGTAALVWLSDGPASSTLLNIARRTPGQDRFVAVAPVALGAAGEEFSSVIVGGDVDVVVHTISQQRTVETDTIRAYRLATGATTVAPVPTALGNPLLDQTSNDQATQPVLRLEQPRIASDGHAIHVLWEKLGGSTTQASSTSVFQATLSAPGAGFTVTGPLDTVSATSNQPSNIKPQLASAPGRVDGIWYGSGPGEVRYLDLNAGGAPKSVTLTNSPTDLRTGLGADGTLLLAWDQVTASEGVQAVYGVTVPTAGAPGIPARLTPGNADRQLDDFATGPDGNALILTDRVNNQFPVNQADVQVQGAFRAAGSSFGALEEVSGSQDQSGLFDFDTSAAALGTGGQAVAVWIADDRGGSPNDRDATPATISSLSVPASAGVGSRVLFAAAASDALSPAVSLRWDFGDGASAPGAAVSHVYGAPGRYSVTVMARDAAGNATTQTRTIVVHAVPDHTPPVISAFAVSNRRFAVGHGNTAVVAGKPRRALGTTFRVTVNERSTLLLGLSGRAEGHRTGHRCALGRGRGAPCTRTVQPGTIVRSGRGPGAVSIPFSGRLEGGRLAPGSYVASLSAIDAAGNRSRARTVRFTVLGG
jgi:PKD domain